MSSGNQTFENHALLSVLTTVLFLDTVRSLHHPDEVRKEFLKRIQEHGLTQPTYSRTDITFEEWVGELQHLHHYISGVHCGGWYLTEYGWRRWNRHLTTLNGTVEIPTVQQAEVRCVQAP